MTVDRLQKSDQVLKKLPFFKDSPYDFGSVLPRSSFLDWYMVYLHPRI